MAAPVPYNSTLDNLNFLMPKAPAAADLYATTAKTAATQQATYDSQQQQVRAEVKQAGDMHRDTVKETQQGMAFLLDHAKQAQDFELKNILLPMELRAKEAQLTAAAAKADQTAFEFEQAKGQAVRDSQERDAFATNMEVLTKNPNAPISATSPAGWSGAVKAAKLAETAKAGTIAEAAQTAVIKSGNEAVALKLMHPNDLKRYNEDEPFQREMMAKVAARQQQNNFTKELGMHDPNPTLIETVDGKPVTYAQAVEDKTGRYREVTGELKTWVLDKVRGAVSLAKSTERAEEKRLGYEERRRIAEIQGGSRETAAAIAAEAKLEQEKLKGFNSLTRTTVMNGTKQAIAELNAGVDLFVNENRTAAQERIADAQIAGRADVAGKTNVSREKIAERMASVREKLGESKTVYQTFKAKLDATTREKITGMELDSRKARDTAAHRAEVFETALRVAGSADKFGRVPKPEEVERKARMFLQGFETSALDLDKPGGAAAAGVNPAAAPKPSLDFLED